MRSGHLKSIALALVVLGALSLSAQASVVTAANGAKTSNKGVKTSTSGQSQILLTIDPFNVAEFSLSIDFESEKVQFVGATGINGYILDPILGHQIDTDGGFLNNIHGYWPGFNSQIINFGLDTNGPLGGGPGFPPPGEVDIFTVLFNVIDENAAFYDFNVFARPNDFIRGIDPATGGFTIAQGPFNGQTGIEPAFLRIPNAPGGPGGPAVPLPPAILAGAALGGWVLGKRKRAA